MKGEGRGIALSSRDRDIADVDDLDSADVTGPRYDAFISDLYNYAWPVMLEAIPTGKIASIETGFPHWNIPADEQQGPARLLPRTGRAGFRLHRPRRIQVQGKP